MKLTRSSDRPTFYPWLVLALAILFIFMHIRLSQYAFDDAYIHFRVARNLLDLGTPYFNANEAVKVSSSSGWTIFLAAWLALVRLIAREIEFPAIISIVNSLISLAGMIVFTKVLEELLPHPISQTKRFFFQVSYLSMISIASIGLMETPLAMLFSLVGIHSLLRSHATGFIWLGIATYFRLELTILVVMLGILFTLNGRFPFWRIILLAGLGIFPFLLYDLYFFHTFVPQSILAKSVVYSITGLHTFTRLILLGFPLGFLNNPLISFSIGLTLVISAFLSIVVVAIRSWNSNQSIWPFMFGIWALSISVGYISRHILLFEWYLPLFTIPLFLTVTLCADQQDSHTNNILSILPSALTIIYLFGLGQTSYASLVNPAIYDQFEAGSRVKTYLEVGRILNEFYPNSTLLSSEIGGLGYTFHGHIWDAAGLASPDALVFHPMKVPDERLSGEFGSIPPKYVAQTRPALIVSYDHFAKAFLANKVAEQYNTVLIPAYLPQDTLYAKRATIWGDPFLRIYIRTDLPVFEDLINLGNNESKSPKAVH